MVLAPTEPGLNEAPPLPLFRSSDETGDRYRLQRRSNRPPARTEEEKGKGEEQEEGEEKGEGEEEEQEEQEDRDGG